MMERLTGGSIRCSGAGGRAGPPRPPGSAGEDGRCWEAERTGIRVFVVEDEAPIAMDLSERLGSLGYRVCGTAARGEAAVKRIAELKPDLVLMDVKLAGAMDGVEAAQRLREFYAVPVVFLTAYSDPQLVTRAVLANCYGFLLKPIKEGQLHATLQMALARFRDSC